MHRSISASIDIRDVSKAIVAAPSPASISALALGFGEQGRIWNERATMRK